MKTTFFKILMVLPMLFVMLGCHTFYSSKTINKEKMKPGMLSKIDWDKNIVVLHIGERLLQMKNATLTNDRITFDQGEFTGLPAEYYRKAPSTGNAVMVNKDRAEVRQVHLFADSYYLEGGKKTVL